MQLKNYAAFATIGLALAAGAATADLVVYHNAGGTFEWDLWGQRTDDYPDRALDITLGPAQDTDAPVNGLSPAYYASTSSLGFDEHFIWAYSTLYPDRLGPTRVAVDPVPVLVASPTGSLLPFDFLQLFEPGESVGPGEIWDTHSRHRVENLQPTGGSYELTGPQYIGVRIELEGLQHYGWIYVNFYDGFQVPQPLAWAYETVPERPALVPAPPVAVALVAAALWTGRHRRRSTHR